VGRFPCGTTSFGIMTEYLRAGLGDGRAGVGEQKRGGTLWSEGRPG